MSNFIPQMTDPLGRYWSQPKTSAIEIDDTHALMSIETFEALAEYSASKPSGVYPGKMWKCITRDERRYLRWYGEVPNDPKVCSINTREVLLVEEAGHE
jgi:hypothetical protein